MTDNIKDKNKTLKRALKDTSPIIASYAVLSIGFGLLMAKNGFGVLWAVAMTLFIYAGSVQYVAVSLLTGGASLVATAMMTLMVNARYFFYSLSMLGKYRHIGKGKFWLIYTLTDETYSLVCNKLDDETIDEKLYCIYVSTFNWMSCMIFTAVGNVAGSMLNFNSTGIDFAMTALFTVIFIEQWLDSKNHIAAIIGVGATLLCLIIFGPSKFLIPAMILITILLIGFRKKLEDDTVKEFEKQVEEEIEEMKENNRN